MTHDSIRKSQRSNSMARAQGFCSCDACVASFPDLRSKATQASQLQGVAGRSSRWGFTLIEVLVSVGIIVLLTAMVLAGVLVARKRGTEIRIRSDLALIGTDLEAYKGDNDGQYPVFADATTDQSGPTTGGGLWLDYTQYRGAVLLCRALIGPGPAGTGAAANPGDDGADGPGFRIRRGVGGKVHGYYADPSKFKIAYQPPPSAYSGFPMAYPVMLDIIGNPILYYPAASGNPVKNLDYLDPSASGSIGAAIPRFNQYDNNALFPNPNDFLTLAAQCGSPPYLLWSAGLDGVFGLDTHGKCDDITNFDLPAQYKK